jgi:hypothetical protein
MRRSLSLVLVSVSIAGWLGVACGSESKADGFKCSQTAIKNGQTVNCESGQFPSGTPAYTCEPASTVSTKTLFPRTAGDGVNATGCPIGTLRVPERDPLSSGGPGIGDLGTGSSSSSSSGSSSGGSSSGDQGGSTSSSSGGSTTGGSSSGDQGGSTSSSSGGTTTGGSSSGDHGESSSSSSGGPSDGGGSCEDGYRCTARNGSTHCVCTKCDQGYRAVNGECVPKGNNGVGNGVDPQPPGNPPVNDGPDASPGNPGNKGGSPGKKDGG